MYCYECGSEYDQKKHKRIICPKCVKQKYGDNENWDNTNRTQIRQKE